MPSRNKHSYTSRADGASDAFSPERFEKELKDLAKKAKAQGSSSVWTEQVVLYIKVAALLALLATCSNVSQLALSPVYGSIPASMWHAKLLMAGCFVGWSGNVLLKRALPMETEKMLPVLAAYVPVVQFFAYGFSGRLGAELGPLLTEALTLIPIVVLTAASVADRLEGAKLGALPKFFVDAGPGIASWGFLKSVEILSQRYLAASVGKTVLYTRVALEVLLAGSYAAFAPSKYLVLAIPALLHLLLFNSHLMTPAALASMNKTLIPQGWMLLDRMESVTGYISVIESLERGFRVMRCDHSLLGGEWSVHPGHMVAEPIYGVFAMLEAVRLVERDAPIADKDASALLM